MKSYWIRRYGTFPAKEDFKGTVTIRIPPELHYICAYIAHIEHRSANSVINDAIAEYLKNYPRKDVQP